MRRTRPEELPWRQEEGVQDLATCSREEQTYVAIAGSSGRISISRSSGHGAVPLEVEVQESSVTAVALWTAPRGPEEEEEVSEEEQQLLLASCSRSCICLCRVDASLRTSSLAWRYRLDGTGLSSPSFISFEPTRALLVAVAVGSEVLVLRVGDGDVLARLQGHGADVTAVHFHPLQPHLLASCCEDGVIKVWDLSGRACIYQTRQACPPDALTCLAIDPTGQLWCASGSEGRLTFYHCREVEEQQVTTAAAAEVAGQLVLVEAFSITLPRPHGLLLLHHHHPLPEPDVSVTLLAVLWQGRVRSLDERPDFEHRMDSSVTVIALAFTPQQTGEPTVTVVTTEGLLLVGGRTGTIRPLTLPEPWQDTAPPFSTASIGHHDIVLASALQPRVLLLPTASLPPPSCPAAAGITPSATSGSVWQRLRGRDPSDGAEAAEAGEGAADEEEGGVEQDEYGPVSLFPSAPLPSWSPLAAIFQNESTTPANKSMAYDHYERPALHKKVPALHDRPVVFHARIKSSGYGTATPTKKTKPPPSKTNTKGTTTSSRGRGTASPTSPAAGCKRPLSQKRYPSDCGPLSHLQPQHDCAPRLPAVLSLSYGGEEAQPAVVAGTIDGAIHVMRLPVSKHQGGGYVLSGHTAPIRHVSPSHSAGKMLLSCSDDGTTRLWSPAISRTSAALVIKPPGGGATSSTPATPQAALFYYLDKFVLLSAGRGVYLYRYTLDLPSKDALLRHHQPATGKCRVVHSWSLDHAQKVTAIDAFNSVLSPTIAAATSDRSLVVLDAAQCRVARLVPDAHGKAAHSLVLPKPSAYSELPPASLDVFATAAIDGTATLWDVRAGLARAATFHEHVNRRERVGLALSPCMRYLAVGSEDGHLFLNDIRMGRACERIPAHEDVVSGVAFHPLHPQLITSGYDGRLRFFTSAEAAAAASTITTTTSRAASATTSSGTRRAVRL